LCWNSYDCCCCCRCRRCYCCVCCLCFLSCADQLYRVLTHPVPPLVQVPRRALAGRLLCGTLAPKGESRMKPSPCCAMILPYPSLVSWFVYFVAQDDVLLRHRHRRYHPLHHGTFATSSTTAAATVATTWFLRRDHHPYHRLRHHRRRRVRRRSTVASTTGRRLDARTDGDRMRCGLM
jgi:hypothetical protein